MRTTVDLPPAAHRRARELATARGQSMSALVSDLVVRSLAEEGAPARIVINERTGMPLLTIGHRITDADVAELLDDE